MSTILRSTATSPPMRSTPIVSLISIRSGRVMRCPMMIRSKVARVVNPRPPTSIRVNITPCPKELQYSAVFSTVRPVTVTAEVEVKKATSREV